MNKISKACIITMAGLLTLSVPAFIGLHSFYNQEKLTHNAKTVFAAEEPTGGLVLSPISHSEISDITEGDYYIIVAYNQETIDEETYTYSAMMGMTNNYLDGFNVTLNSDYSLNVDDYFYQILPSVNQFVVDQTTGNIQIINHGMLRYLIGAVHPNEYSYFYTSLTMANHTYDFENGHYDNSFFMSLYVPGSGSSTSGPSEPERVYASIDGGMVSSSFSLDTTTKSDFFLYRLPSGFYESYCWPSKINAISQTDDAQDLLTMWQSFGVYDKENILANFYVPDPTNPSSSAYDYTSNTDLGLDVIHQKFQLYEQIVGAVYEKPFICQDVDANSIVLDYDKRTISGFSPLDRLYYRVESRYVDFNVNISGVYSFANSNSDDPNSMPFAGESVTFYYGSSSFSDTYSANGATITFPAFQEATVIEVDSITENFSQIGVLFNGDNNIEYIDHNFDDSFAIAELPYGYETALVTTSFYEYYEYEITQPSEYGEIPAGLIPFSTSNVFEHAYDEAGREYPVTGETTYYLLFRLPANSDYLASPICGYTTFITIAENDCFTAKAQTLNYKLFDEYLNSSTYSSAAYTYYDEFIAFHQQINEDILSCESMAMLEDYLESRSLDDRYYVECSKYALFSLYHNASSVHPSDRKDAIMQELMAKFQQLVGTTGTVDREAVEAFIEENAEAFNDEINLITYQEYAAMEMSYYFNSCAAEYLVYDNLDDAFEILKTYIDLVYETTTEDEIEEVVSEYKTTLRAWFKERSGL